MEMYARYYGDYDFPISDFLWGSLIFVALVASVILAGKALEWLRNRKRPDGEAVVERGQTKDWLTETLAEVWHSDHRTGTPGTTPHDNADEVSLIDKPRKQRKGFKERRKRMGERKASDRIIGGR